MTDSSICDYPSLIEAIRERPCMYHGGAERNIHLLSAFIAGIRFSEVLNNNFSEELLGKFDWLEFEKWVEAKFNEKRLSLNSFGLAGYHESSDSKAFDLWFSWYDQFQVTNPNHSR